MVQKREKKTEPAAIKAQRRKLKDYILDPANPNRGTVRGESMLETSVELFGPARSGVVDNQGVIRAGNHTAEQLMAAGIEDVIEIETTGQEWVIVKRADMDKQTGQQYAVADNRTGQLIDWSPDVLQALKETGMDLSPFWTPEELEALLPQETLPPEDFPSYDENLDTEYCCPKCGYKWSGKPSA